MDNNSFIYQKGSNGEILAGGYKINSKLMEGGRAAISNVKMQKRGGLETLAVPAGLFLLQQSIASNTNALNIIRKEPEVVGDKLYSKLLEMVHPKNQTKKRKTRKHIKKKQRRKTRRRS